MTLIVMIMMMLSIVNYGYEHDYGDHDNNDEDNYDELRHY